MYRKIFWLVLIFAISGCSGLFNFKAPYPVITLYKLDQTDTSDIASSTRIDAALQIRAFGINSAYDTDHLLAESGPGQMTRYYYHRWASNLHMMMTDFIIERYSRTEIFTKGVLSQVSSLPADYILEGQIIKAVGVNTNDTARNSAEMSLKVELIQNDERGKHILLSKVYTRIEPRTSADAPTIAPALSNAASHLSDEILKDIMPLIRRRPTADSN